MPPPPVSESGDIPTHLRGFLLASIRFLRARFELLGIEGKEAFNRVAAVLLTLVACVTLILTGYLLLCLAMVFLLARLIGSEHAWMGIAAVTGALHLALAWGILLFARKWIRSPMFPATLEEFKKDEAWLKSTAARPN
ncbi:MAG: hypothetical protein RLZZ142_660 [Verrucomicrobiota bacterium]